jgi:hypothetical protein
VGLARSSCFLWSTGLRCPAKRSRGCTSQRCRDKVLCQAISVFVKSSRDRGCLVSAHRNMPSS